VNAALGGLGRLIAVRYEYPLSGGGRDLIFAVAPASFLLVAVAGSLLREGGPQGGLTGFALMGCSLACLAVYFLYRGEFFIFTRGFVKRTPFGTRALLDKDIAEFSFSVTQEYTSYVTQDNIFRLALWPRGGTSLKPIRYRGYSKGGPGYPREDALLNGVLARLAQGGAVDRKEREARDWKGREHLPLSFGERCRVVGLALLFLVLMLVPTLVGWAWIVFAGFAGIVGFFQAEVRHGWEGIGTGFQAGDRGRVMTGLLGLGSPILYPLAFIAWNWFMLGCFVAVIGGLRGRRTRWAKEFLRPLTSEGPLP
jgi:hypothetical protein